MNTRIKIAAGVIAGLVVGATLVGTAYAAPRVMAAQAFGGPAMMRSYGAPVSLDRPTVAEMNSFMDRYRTGDGRIDFDRMHSDVASGRVTPPCLDGADTPGTGSTRGSSRGGYGMMGSIY